MFYPVLFIVQSFSLCYNIKICCVFLLHEAHRPFPARSLQGCLMLIQVHMEKERITMQFYIDPGTGSMLFTILVGVLSAGIYALRGFFMKLRFWFTGGSKVAVDENRLPFVIFADDKRYWNTFGPICDEFERRGQALTYMTASPNDPALEKHYEHVKCEFIGEGNKAFAKLNMLRADLVLSTTPGLDVYQWKRSKDVKWYAHVLHAPSDPTVYRMFGLDYYDAVLLCGEYQVRQQRSLEQLRNLPAKELPIVGLPYLDGLLERLQKAQSVGEHPRTVLLAPSWGKSAIFSVYGKKMIDALLATGYHVIIRPHPQSFTSEKDLIEGLMKDYPDSEQLEWNRDNDNFDALHRADIMISDFSGVIFDFALVFDKPIIYADTSFDTAPYDASWLDEQPWTFGVLPRIGEKLTADKLDDMKSLIDHCLADERFSKARQQAREETWANMGKSVPAVVDYLMKKQEELKTK